jgi:hypothetical protein
MIVQYGGGAQLREQPTPTENSLSAWAPLCTAIAGGQQEVDCAEHHCPEWQRVSIIIPFDLTQLIGLGPSMSHIALEGPLLHPFGLPVLPRLDFPKGPRNAVGDEPGRVLAASSSHHSAKC